MPVALVAWEQGRTGAAAARVIEGRRVVRRAVSRNEDFIFATIEEDSSGGSKSFGVRNMK
jgi:hypothetical protein